MAKLSKPTTADEFDAEHGRHPNDIAAEKAAVVEAEERIGPWFEANKAALIATIQLFPDDEASDLFEALREHFWVREEKPFKWRKP